MAGEKRVMKKKQKPKFIKFWKKQRKIRSGKISKVNQTIKILMKLKI